VSVYLSRVCAAGPGADKEGMKRRRPSRAAPILIGAALFVACSARDGGDRTAPALDASVQGELSSRAEGWFDRGWLSKPSDAFEASEAFALAPLLVHVAAEDSSGALTRPSIGAVSRDARGDLVVDPSRPTVYFETTTTRIAGREHRRWSYLWWYAASAERTTIAGFQGLRMTLDEAGYPLLWEVLSDRSGARVLFVSVEFESVATEAFSAPDIVVAGSLESGPLPMGPFAYLDGRSKDIVTVICRCMPSQVGEIDGSDYYRLAPLGSLREIELDPPWPGVAD